jgi:hypothetical protein
MKANVSETPNISTFKYPGKIFKFKLRYKTLKEQRYSLNSGTIFSEMLDSVNQQMQMFNRSCFILLFIATWFVTYLTAKEQVLVSYISHGYGKDCHY